MSYIYNNFPDKNKEYFRGSPECDNLWDQMNVHMNGLWVLSLHLVGILHKFNSFSKKGSSPQYIFSTFVIRQRKISITFKEIIIRKEKKWLTLRRKGYIGEKHKGIKG